MTSLDAAPSDTVETRVSFRFAVGDDLPASLIAHVHPNHSDNGWNWYAGYTVELDPKAHKIRLLAAHRANKPQELAAASVDIVRDVWLPIALHVDGKHLVVRVAERDVITNQPERLLPPGHFGITTRGKAQIRDFAVVSTAGPVKPVALHPNPLLSMPGDALNLRCARVQTGSAPRVVCL